MESSLSVYPTPSGAYEAHYDSYEFYSELKTYKNRQRGRGLFTLTTSKAVFQAQFAPVFARLSKKYFSKVNVSALPADVARLFDHSVPKRMGDTGKTPHSTLFLLDSAPEEVIKAAYKALSRTHHPDVGGDPERFQEINNAYRSIMHRSQES